MGGSVFQKLRIINKEKKDENRRRNKRGGRKEKERNGKGWEGREVNGWKRKVGEIGGKKKMSRQEVKKKSKNKRQITVEDIKKF